MYNTGNPLNLGLVAQLSERGFQRIDDLGNVLAVILHDGDTHVSVCMSC